jgi:hypothetical protein
MVSNPDPNEVRTIFDCQYTMVQPNTRRPKSADLFEMQGWMLWILLE